MSAEAASATSFREQLAARHARFGVDGVTDFGDLQGELEALGRGATLHPLCDDGLIRVTGADAEAFLQAQLSNDIRELDQGRAQLTTWCTAQGRMLASFLAWREADDYVLQLPLELLASVRARLERFVLRAQVRVLDASASWALLGVGGESADATLSAVFDTLPTAPNQLVRVRGAAIVLLGRNLYQLAVATEDAHAIWDTLASRARAVGTRGWTWRRIRACLPTITAATQDKFVPQMADMERIGAVSFGKGCYPGQEIVARAQYLGEVKRRLHRVRSSVAMVAGEEVLADGTPAGTILNAAPAPAGDHEALAVLHVEAAARGALTLRGSGAPLALLGACH